MRGRDGDGVWPLLALADQFAEWLQDKPTGERIWPGNWWQRAAEAIAVDLRAARISVLTDEGVCDAHSLRTTMITNVVATGAPLPLVMRVCRLSSASLLDNYGLVELIMRSVRRNGQGTKLFYDLTEC